MVTKQSTDRVSFQTNPWKPGYLRSAYAAICCKRFKPKDMTEDIFIAEILGHKLLQGGTTTLPVGQSYKDFYLT